ncbi:hypothetical protein MYX82_11140 [Acidobacteria bacterium AH-259-D05]|nr:hypothetical protein [Acidobacteria bacterium AH-259-D05]
MGSETRYRNIVSVSWGDHLVFGEGDGRLDTPEAVICRMQRWREELGASTVHWRLSNTRIQGHFRAAKGYRYPSLKQRRSIKWDDFKVVPQVAHTLGMRAYLYASLFDEGWPLAPKKVREVSYHNAMHGQHVCWQSTFSEEHPEYAMADRSGQERQWGVLCLAYPEVRSHFCQRFQRLLEESDFDGLFVCLRSQSKPADFADQYGFNGPVRDDFEARYSRDIWKEDFPLTKWRDLLGEYLALFLAELRTVTRSKGLRLAVGCARGDVIGPPLGNLTLEWRQWIEKELIDELIINQNSSRCPSMWHDLWPMHRGYGYVQQYLDGLKRSPLQKDLATNYTPAFEGQRAELYVVRQWDERSEAEEKALLNTPVVRGLVYSSFRFDNPGPVARNNWIA